jgi:hypothetical protein
VVIYSHLFITLTVPFTKRKRFPFSRLVERDYISTSVSPFFETSAAPLQVLYNGRVQFSGRKEKVRAAV